MLSENRKYNFIGELIIKRSRTLDVKNQPRDDKVNWLFLNSGKHQYSFVYKIHDPLEAKYGLPFRIDMSFNMIEVVNNILRINDIYEVLRGQEIIGKIKIISLVE